MNITDAIELKNISCKNRLIRSAVHSFLGTEDGHLSAADFAMYETLAKSGIGLIITGHVCVQEGGRANINQPNIFADEYIEDFAQGAKIAHKYGAKFVVQLNHAGPRAVDNDDLADVTERELKKGKFARRLRLDEIKNIENAFITAAARIKAAGADGVQLHAAHSYLLSRFIDPTFNTRDDEYGGNAKNRFRMAENIILGIKEKCGANFPVFIKINSDTNADNDAYEQDMIYILNRAGQIGAELAELSGVDFINQPKTDRLYYLSRAERLKKAVPDMPLSLVGGVRSLGDAQKVLAAGVDMVSLGRALIADNDFAARLLEGEDAPTKCVSCSRCFVLPNKHPGLRCVWELKKARANK